ncbi:hypothetical protein ACFV2N_47725 [Streptomyces sp. NPDC059680]|uniref:hypothetical protein n=1 Tax=Streptomyces sp. NPDC059680 TaxID=3346904 RepID=UPI0036BDDCA6
MANLSKQVITEARKTPERSWPGAVCRGTAAVPADLGTAYSSFFACFKGTRKGLKIAEPLFKSKRGGRPRNTAPGHRGIRVPLGHRDPHRPPP